MKSILLTMLGLSLQTNVEWTCRHVWGYMKYEGRNVKLYDLVRREHFTSKAGDELQKFHEVTNTYGKCWCGNPYELYTNRVFYTFAKRENNE